MGVRPGDSTAPRRQPCRGRGIRLHPSGGPLDDGGSPLGAGGRGPVPLAPGGPPPEPAGDLSRQASPAGRHALRSLGPLVGPGTEGTADLYRRRVRGHLFTARLTLQCPGFAAPLPGPPGPPGGRTSDEGPLSVPAVRTEPSRPFSAGRTIPRGDLLRNGCR